MRYLYVIVAIAIISGCASVSQSNLYWGNYSQTLYKMKKEPSDETRKAHEAELLSIVDKSNERNLRVPPGVYAELGIYAKNRGDNKAAENYFRLEEETYPESSVLMQHTLMSSQQSGS